MLWATERKTHLQNIIFGDLNHIFANSKTSINALCNMVTYLLLEPLHE